MRTEPWRYALYGAVVVAFVVCARRTWPNRKAFVEGEKWYWRIEQRELAAELQALAKRERQRAWRCPGLAARQAAWNAAKAEYSLYKTNALNPRTQPTPALLARLRQDLARLLRAEEQSRLGRREGRVSRPAG